MQYITVIIPNQEQAKYTRLAEALACSVAENTDCELQVIIGEADLETKDTRHYQHYIGQTEKQRAWNKIVQEAQQDELLCLLDADMLVLKDIAHVFEGEFDICYTHMPFDKHFRLNTGVLFVKTNERTKAFFNKWREVNEEMQASEGFHKLWHPLYQGMDQTSFGYMVENHPEIANLASVPCMHYNACFKESWKLTENTHILHVKGLLRELVLGTTTDGTENFREAIATWHHFNNQPKQ